MFRLVLPAFVAAFIVLSCIFFVHVLGVAFVLSTPTLAPDLAFFYSCPAPDNTMADDLKVDLFLKNNGFEVQDVGELRRELGIPGSYPQFISAVDGQRRMITISGEDGTLNHEVTLYSEPPTVRSTKLENDILAFAVNNLKCTVGYVHRDKNAESAKGRYGQMFSLTEGQISQFHDERFLDSEGVIQPGGSITKANGQGANNK